MGKETILLSVFIQFIYILGSIEYSPNIGNPRTVIDGLWNDTWYFIGWGSTPPIYALNITDMTSNNLVSMMLNYTIRGYGQNWIQIENILYGLAAKNDENIIYYYDLNYIANEPKNIEYF